MTKARDIASGLGAESGEVVPHIKLDVLYPSYVASGTSNKLLDGTTAHSGDFGTAQSDGRKYYYTNIAGSKPIKDPRIGVYFGSQRHMFKSLQLLKQETATHGSNVYSIDGREWLKAVDSSGTWVVQNNTAGNYLEASGGNCTGNFIEITGYFNDINFSFYTHSNRCDDIDISVNGTLSVDGSTTLGGKTTVESPLGGRYVNASSFINGGSTLSTSLGTTPKINTIRYEAKTGSSEYISINGIELIAQDTTSTANKSKIQIPAQTVISYGKKHSISATAEHYDPFNGFVNDTTLFSAKVDTATSLGLGTATTWGCPWDKGSDDHIRPLNGGRVVKWIANDSTIKTSVTMMPRNAQNRETTASNEITTASATNAHTINFSDDVIENSLSEVAIRLYAREFGNGSANGGAGASFADASMLNDSSDDITYVMDDGLTALSGEDVRIFTDSDAGAGGEVTPYADGDNVYITFIGTGIGVTSYRDGTSGGLGTVAINLPYGTHMLKIARDPDADPDVTIDGVALDDINIDNNGAVHEITIFQPKMPPVPEDACIIADYMLMADFVKQTDAEPTQLSKGTRVVSASRDVYYDSAAAHTGLDLYVGGESCVGGLRVTANGSNTMTAKLPFFGTTGLLHAYGTSASLTLGGSATTEANLDNSAGPQGDAYSITETVTLGMTDITATIAAGSGMFAFQVTTPIHTSSHYSEFETPYLKELIGGDQNMEQTNLVVSPSGQTWDSVTRDTSYLGLMKTMGALESNQDTANGIIIPTEWRGSATVSTDNPMFNKDFAIAYDRLICLVDGQYNITFNQFTNDSLSAWSYQKILINGTTRALTIASDADWYTANISGNFHLKRGDYIQISGIGHTNEMIYQINRI